MGTRYYTDLDDLFRSIFSREAEVKDNNEHVDILNPNKLRSIPFVTKFDETNLIFEAALPGFSASELQVKFVEHNAKPYFLVKVAPGDSKDSIQPSIYGNNVPSQFLLEIPDFKDWDLDLSSKKVIVKMSCGILRIIVPATPKIMEERFKTFEEFKVL